MASLLVRIGADITELEKNLSDAGKRISNIGSSMEKAGKTLTKTVTAPIIGLGTASVLTGVQFDQGMSKVAAISGATGESLNSLRNMAIQLGEATQFSAMDAASGMESLARSGFRVEEIMGAMPGLLDLAAAGALDLGLASSITANVVRGFSLEASEAGRVADVLALAAASANTDVAGMGESMKFVAPVAASLGFELEEIAAATGIFADAGIDAGMAGRSLRMGILRLAKPTEEAAMTMSELGLKVFDNHGNMLSLTEIVRQLEKGTAGLTSEQKAQALATLFGTESVSGFTALLNRGSDDLNNFTNKLKGSEGSAKNMAAVMMDNLGGSLDELSSSVETAMISISDLLTPAIRGIVDRLTEAVRWFTGLDDGVKRTIITVAGIVAAVGPVLLIFGKLFGFIGTMLPKLSALSAFIGGLSVPLLLIIGIIGLFIAKGVEMLGGWENTLKILQNLFSQAFGFVSNNVIGPFFSGLMGKGNETQSGVASLFGRIGEVVRGLGGIFNKVLGIVEEVISYLIDFWKRNGEFLVNTFMDYWNRIIGFFTPVVESLIRSFDVLFSYIRPIWDNIKELIIGIMPVLEQIWMLAVEIFDELKIIFSLFGAVVATTIIGVIGALNGLIRALGPFINTIIEMIKFVVNMIGLVLAVLRGDWDGAWKFLVEVGKSALNIIVGLFNTIVEFIKGFVDGVIGLFKGLWKMLVGGSIIPDIVNGILNWFKSLFDKGMEVIRNLINNIVSHFREFPGKVISSISGLVGSIIAKGREIGSGLFNSIKDQINKIPGSIRDIFNNAISLITNLGKSMVSAAKNAATNLWNGFKGAIGLKSPSYIERAFMDMDLTAQKALSNIKKYVPSFERSMSRMVQPVPISPSSGFLGGGLGFSRQMSEEALKGLSEGPEKGVRIEVGQMIVRNDNDIELIAERLYRLQQTRLRGQGSRG